MKIIYSCVFQVYGLVFYLLARIFFRIRIYGQEKILSAEKQNNQNNLGRIFVLRHWSCWDPVLLAAAFWKLQFEHIFLYDTTRYVAKDNLKTLFKYIPCLNSFTIFINQKYQKSAIREMIDLLKKGTSIVIFPEGSVVPENKKIGGLVSLVIEQVEEMTVQRVAIFPINIKPSGCDYGKPRGKWYRYLIGRVKIDLKIGKHVFLNDVEKIISKEIMINKHRREKIVEELLQIADQI